MLCHRHIGRGGSGGASAISHPSAPHVFGAAAAAETHRLSHPLAITSHGGGGGGPLRGGGDDVSPRMKNNGGSDKRVATPLPSGFRQIPPPSSSSRRAEELARVPSLTFSLPRPCACDGRCGIPHNFGTKRENSSGGERVSAVAHERLTKSARNNTGVSLSPLFYSFGA